MTKPNATGWAGVKRKSQRLRGELKKLLDDLQTAVASPDADLIAAAIITRDELDEWSRFLQEAGETTAGIHDRLDQKAATLAECFEPSLGNALKEAGFEVYGDGRLLIANGIVYIETDVPKGRATVNGEPLSSLRFSDLVSSVAAAFDQMKQDMTAPDVMLKQMRVAYDLACRRGATEPGSQIQTLSLLPELVLMHQKPGFRLNPVREQYTAYPLTVFRADFYSLLLSGQLEDAGWELRYASGSDTKGAVFMLVPALGRTAHIGRVWFERSDNE